MPEYCCKKMRVVVAGEASVEYCEDDGREKEWDGIERLCGE